MYFVPKLEYLPDRENYSGVEFTVSSDSNDNSFPFLFNGYTAKLFH